MILAGAVAPLVRLLMPRDEPQILRQQFDPEAQRARQRAVAQAAYLDDLSNTPMETNDE